ncbi:hypothetical protein [Nitrospirillum amazonense]|uniref:hypothetical protein n=1 Tax=Nitrospirillum amazonense TaxID=28077 RepID=UPI0016445AB8|nr:hypothetical protein [Nitrospirillum amazonense]
MSDAAAGGRGGGWLGRRAPIKGPKFIRPQSPNSDAQNKKSGQTISSPRRRIKTISTY